jgi:hypothetical protein
VGKRARFFSGGLVDDQVVDFVGGSVNGFAVFVEAQVLAGEVQRGKGLTGGALVEGGDCLYEPVD